jgi:hypothetical protein
MSTIKQITFHFEVVSGGRADVLGRAVGKISEIFKKFSCDRCANFARAV